MSCHLHDLVFRQLVPESIRSDSQIAAAADAISPFLQTIVRAVPNLLIYGRLEEQDPAGMLAPLRRLTEARGGLKNLSTEELEQLAWQWHVDFRDAAKTNEKLRAFVLNSVPWHRIKGTPAAMRRVLDLYGYTAEIEEDGEGENWAAYQLRFDSIPSEADLKKISRICADVEPARCRLWRVYVSEYDLRPFLWSGGLDSSRNASLRGWSEGLWSAYTGRELDDISGETDGQGLIASFGRRLRLLSEPFAAADMAVGGGREEGYGILCPYVDRPIWSHFDWSDADFPPMTGVTIGQLTLLTWAIWCQNTGESSPRPDRVLTPWGISSWSAPRVVAVWSWPSDGGESGDGVAVHASGTWGDVNCTYGRTPGMTAEYDAIYWGDAWGTATNLRTEEILSRSQVGIGASITEPAVDGTETAASVAGDVAAQTGEKERAWSGTWSDSRRWLIDDAFVSVTTEGNS